MHACRLQELALRQKEAQALADRRKAEEKQRKREQQEFLKGTNRPKLSFSLGK